MSEFIENDLVWFFRAVSQVKPSLRTALALLSLVLCSLTVAAAEQPPLISKVDPPDWWQSLPDPLLLIRGDHLTGASFALAGTRASIHSTRISPDGTWAFLQLAMNGADPGTFTIQARNTAGVGRWPYTLAPRRGIADQPRGFSARDVMYLIMTDRFADGDPSNDRQPGMPYDPNDPHAWHGGDFRGVAERLDYLKDLGVTTVWLTPVYQNREPDSYHGYGATDVYAVDDHFGSLADLKSLADQLHARDMKLVLDIVPNHVGPLHPWVANSPTPDWFHGTKARHRLATGDFQNLMSLTASERDRRDVLEGWFVDLLPDLNQENPLVSQYLIQNTIWWVASSGADGIRLDTFPYVGRQFWHDYHAQLRQLYPNLTTVGEVFNGTFALPPALNAFFAGDVVRSGQRSVIDTGLYTPFDYPLFSALRSVLIHDAPMTDLSLLLGQDTLYPHPERLVTLLGSHDTKRFLSEDGANPEELKLAFGILATFRGMPVIYSGDEIGMTGGDDPDNRRDFPGGFPQERPRTNGFTQAGRDPQEREIHDWLQRILAIRKANTELQTGGQQFERADADTLGFVRGEDLQHGCTASGSRILVLINRSSDAKTMRFDTAETALDNCTRPTVLLGDDGSVQVTAHTLTARIAPHALSIIRMRE